MASKNNDEMAGIVMLLSFVCVILLYLFLFVFAVLAFMSLIMTFLCILALEDEFRIGRLVISPMRAGFFLLRGVAGGVLVPAFIGFCIVLFDFPFEWKYWPYFVLFGYVIASMGLEILIFWSGKQQIEIAPPIHKVPHEPQKLLRPAPREPFRYASWDDEEKRQK